MSKGKAQTVPTSVADAPTPRHFRTFLRGTFHHYSSILTGRFGFLLNLIFRLLLRRVKIAPNDRSQLQNLAEKGTICYVTRSRSRLEYLLLSFKLRQEGLPFPQFCHYLSVWLWQPWGQTFRRLVGVVVSWFEGHGYPNPYEDGFVRQLILDRVPTLLPLHHFRGLPWRFSRRHRDPLEELIMLRRACGQTIMMVPVVIIYGRRPDKDRKSLLDLIAGPPDNPGRLRRLLRFFGNLSHLSINVAEPQELLELEAVAAVRVPMMAERLPETAYHIRQTLLERIEAERRVVLGPARKSRAEVVEMVLHEKSFVAALLEYCQANNAPFYETRERARRYLEEMAGDFRPGTIQFLYWLFDRLLKKVYTRIEVDEAGLERVRKVARRMPVVFMPCHKSHLDYILLDYMIYKNQYSLPLTVSGINLNFWPVGWLFRGAGAFFIRRAFRGKRIYSLCLTRYLSAVLREGLNLTFFVEGGRSRVGKLLVPKTGFLQYLLEAMASANRRDLAFVPVSIGYEKIFEESFYTKEATGRPNEGENLRTVLRNRRMIRSQQGRAWLDFGEPITLQELLDQRRLVTVPRSEGAIRDLATRIAQRTVFAINELQPVTPYAIVAEALLAGTRRGVPAQVIIDRYALIENLLRASSARITIPRTDPTAIVLAILNAMVAAKVLGRQEGGEEDEPFYFLDEARRMALSIYANTVVPHHQYASLLALALLGAKEPKTEHDLLVDFRSLMALMTRELVLGKEPERTREDDERDFAPTWRLFVEREWVDRHDQSYDLSATGRFAAETLAAMVSGYAESYWLAARALLQRKAERFSDKDFVKAAMAKGQRAVSVGEMAHPEAVHKVLLENALRHFSDLGLVRTERVIGEKTKAATYNHQVADYVGLREIADNLRRYSPVE